MEKIKWCLNVKNGMELIEPNENLSRIYIKKSEGALLASSKLKDARDWEISSSYYAMYFALYAVLTRAGIKCEIHNCTIECAKVFLSDYFNENDCKMLKKAMDARIDAQYYVDRHVAEEQYRAMIKEAPLFLVKCKGVLLKIKDNEIETIRKNIKNMSKKTNV